MEREEFWGRAAKVWAEIGPDLRRRVEGASLPRAFAERAKYALDAMDGLIHRDEDIVRVDLANVSYVFGSTGLDAGRSGDRARALASAIEDRVFIKRSDRLSFLLGEAERVS